MFGMKTEVTHTHYPAHASEFSAEIVYYYLKKKENKKRNAEKSHFAVFIADASIIAADIAIKVRHTALAARMQNCTFHGGSALWRSKA